MLGKRRLGRQELEVSAPGVTFFDPGRERGGPATTDHHELMRQLALAGVGLLYTFEQLVADELRRGALRLVLEPYAAAVPGFFPYFASRSRASPAFRAFVDLAREPAPGGVEPGRRPARGGADGGS